MGGGIDFLERGDFSIDGCHSLPIITPVAGGRYGERWWLHVGSVQGEHRSTEI